MEFVTLVDLKNLEEKYEAFCNLDEVAVFSLQDLNVDFVGCVRDALNLHDEANYIAKFVLNHLAHYVEFCEVMDDSGSLREMGDLIGDIVCRFGDKLEPEVKEVFMDLSKDFDLIEDKNMYSLDLGLSYWNVLDLVEYTKKYNVGIDKLGWGNGACVDKDEMGFRVYGSKADIVRFLDDTYGDASAVLAGRELKVVEKKESLHKTISEASKQCQSRCDEGLRIKDVGCR